MKTLGKLIARLIFGPSLEDYEARQRADAVKALKRIHTAYQAGKIPQATLCIWGKDTVEPAMSEDERREAQTRAALIKQIEMQKQILQKQTKGILQGVTGDSGTITVSR